MSEGIGGFALKEPIYTRRWSTKERGQKRSETGYLEDGLHLVELSPRMLSCKHLDDQAPNAPYISLLRVRNLFDNFGGHPINRTLERRTVQSISWHEIFQRVV